MAEPDSAWFDNIYRQYQRKLLTVAFRLLNDWGLAEDITQNVFLTLYLKQDSLRSHPNIQGWLFHTLRNHIMNETQKAFRTREVALLSDGSPAVNLEYTPSLSDSLPSGLGQEELLLLHLFFEEGLNHEEIAARLGCSVEACRMRLYRAKAHCKKLLEPHSRPGIP